MIARLKGDSIPIRQRRPDLAIPPGVERVLARALAGDAAERYPSALEFGDAFSRAAAGEDPEPLKHAENGSGIMSRIFSRFRRPIGRS